MAAASRKRGRAASAAEEELVTLAQAAPKRERPPPRRSAAEAAVEAAVRAAAAANTGMTVQLGGSGAGASTSGDAPSPSAASTSADIDSMLEASEAAMQAQDAERPTATDAEKTALREYRDGKLEMERLRKEAAAECKALRASIKTSRTALAAYMAEHGLSILQLPNAVVEPKNRELEARAMAAMPHYLRLKQKHRDRPITGEHIAEALAATTPQDVLDAYETLKEGSSLEDALVEAIVRHVVKLVREFHDDVELTDALQRGVKPFQVKLAPRALVESSLRVHEEAQTVRAATAAKATALKALAARVEAQAPLVKTYMQRTGREEQTLRNPHDATDALKVKVEVKDVVAPLRVPAFRTLLKATLAEQFRGAKSRRDLERLLADANKELLRRQLNTRVAALPPRHVESVKLVHVGGRRPKADDEEGGEGEGGEGDDDEEADE
jgi:hypothetical protein